MPSLTNRLKLALPNGNEYVNRAALNKIFEDIDKLVMLQGDFNTSKKEIDDNLAGKVTKSGDTMTGNLKLPRLETTDQTPVIFNGNTNNRSWKWDMLGDNLSVTPTNSSAPGWDFSKTVTLQNLLKKTGDTMSGNLTLDGSIGERALVYKVGAGTGDLIGIRNVLATNIFSLRDYRSGIDVWSWNGTIFNVNSETNLLKKTGDTMGGSLNFDTTTEKKLAAVDSTNKLLHGMVFRNNLMQYYDFLKSKSIFSYDLTNELFYVTANTNLLKKTGDVMTGALSFNNTSVKNGVQFQSEGKSTSILGGDATRVNLWDNVNSQDVWSYSHANKVFNVNADTNLLKKTGDTATGEMVFRNNIHQQSSDGKNGIVSVINSSQTKWAVGPRVEGAVDWSKELSMSLITGEVSVSSLKVKGERALTISDGEEKTPSRSGKDENGIFTTYEETQEDGKLWKQSVLSNPDADGNYLVRTVTYYKDGVAYKTKIFDLKYDEDGDFVKAVPR